MEQMKPITFRDAFNRRSILYAALMFALQLFTYLVPTIFTPVLHLNDITMPLDNLIPFVPVFIIPYVLVFLEWGYFYLLAPLLGRERWGRYTAALTLGFAAIFIIFFAFPTTYTRPETEGGSFFARIMGYVFGIDQPSRCLPSLHCYLGWMNWRLVYGQQRVPKWLRVTALVVALVTLPTTLLVKQHVIVDVPSGVLMAELAWYAAGKTKLPEVFLGAFEKIAAKAKVN
ncbi:MAG TPA: hypothetical protein VN540_04225 [Clostridia bacterium]|nr:hypothetical protein [Clostridia bacterium]